MTLAIKNFSDFAKIAKKHYSKPVPSVSKVWCGRAYGYYAYIRIDSEFIYTRSFKDYSFLKRYLLREFGDFNY